MGDVDAPGIESDFAIAKIVAPHAVEMIIKAQGLDLGPGVLERHIPSPQGFTVGSTEREMIGDC